MKYTFPARASMMTAAEIGVVGGSMLLTQKFLDFNVIFKNQIAKNPDYVNRWWIRHQGAVKFAVGVLAAVHIDNPWLRLLAFGVAANGLVQEVRVLAVKDGAPLFDKIGQNDLDAKLLQAAKNVGGPIGTEYKTMVAGPGPIATQYPTQVARPIDLMNTNYTDVGRVYMERGMGVVMMER